MNCSDAGFYCQLQGLQLTKHAPNTRPTVNHSQPSCVGVSWRHLLILFLPPSTFIPFLSFSMSGPTVLERARNVVVSGTVTAANTVREKPCGTFLMYSKLTAVNRLQIILNHGNITMSDAVIPVKRNSSTRFNTKFVVPLYCTAVCTPGTSTAQQSVNFYHSSQRDHESCPGSPLVAMSFCDPTLDHNGNKCRECGLPVRIRLAGPGSRFPGQFYLLVYALYNAEVLCSNGY